MSSIKKNALPSLFTFHLLFVFSCGARGLLLTACALCRTALERARRKEERALDHLVDEKGCPRGLRGLALKAISRSLRGKKSLERKRS